MVCKGPDELIEEESSENHCDRNRMGRGADPVLIFKRYLAPLRKSFPHWNMLCLLLSLYNQNDLVN